MQSRRSSREVQKPKDTLRDVTDDSTEINDVKAGCGSGNRKTTLFQIKGENADT